MLSYQTVNSHTLELLKKLTNEEFLSKARLVGGTALALQYGHRISIDLDFFGNIEEDNETIKEVLINIGKLSVIKESKNIIRLDRKNFLKNMCSTESFQCPNFHLPKTLTTKLSLTTQRLLSNKRVRTD